jgi:CubicO group peptidase (beta-lactamase class C family)
MRYFCQTILMCAVAFLPNSASASSPAPPDKVDEHVQAEMRKQHIPGLALGVYRDGQIVKAQGYGLSNLELNVPVKPETIFQSGSLGKQFTATAIMMLVEEGKIGTDDRIVKYFPEAPKAWERITVRNLLTHTSGLKDYTAAEMTKPGGPINYRADYSEDQLLRIIESFPMDFQPGEKWAYCNSNYLLLGIIIHKVKGEFYGDFLQERIFQPLGMTATRIISEADIIPNRAAGYRWLHRQLNNQEWVSPSLNTTADGALYFNILDLAKWDAALYTEKLLKKSSLDQMWTVAKLNDGKPNSGDYGFAWVITQSGGHRIIEHGGSWQGFTTHISRYVDDKLTVVVLTNLDSGHSDPGKVAHAVAGLYVPALAPPPLKAIADKEPLVTARLRDLVHNIAAAKANPKAFAPEAKAELFPNDMEGMREDLEDAGPLQSLELLERKEKGGERHYRYRGVFHNTRLMLDFTLNSADKIASISESPE